MAQRLALGCGDRLVAVCVVGHGVFGSMFREDDYKHLWETQNPGPLRSKSCLVVSVLPTDVLGSDGSLDASPQGVAERVLASRPRQHRHGGESWQGGLGQGLVAPSMPSS